MEQHEINVNRVIKDLGEYPDLSYQLIFTTKCKLPPVFIFNKKFFVKNIIRALDKYGASYVTLNITSAIISTKNLYDVEYFFYITLFSTDIFIKDIKNDLYILLQELIQYEVTFVNCVCRKDGSILVRSEL